ncbi:UxaA family hydrolase [Paenibacillus naphthalenovorans]|uniref:UxaA family hydrolase n=1 Tax=Paenibacillus naphthalenovorans TaxID=162209 RepID=UPI000891B7C4|nr:UxaA family hydrolase [Paenibacillus naphthalenovorans]GCL71516.1 D-galactarate dehydratase [Paenibacillus naphthalenovorans]SDI82642.1 altronate dehydratase small subunit [Paenibacillus naphthalenovorans]
METNYSTVMMKPVDNVAVALTNIPGGTVVTVNCGGNTIAVELKENIEFGHKFAVAPISSGQDILKYGEVIGVAVKDIAVGEHVHVHNLEGKRGRGDRIVS